MDTRQFMGVEWKKIGSGSFNTAYLYTGLEIKIAGNYGPWVIKKQHSRLNSIDNKLDQPERINRLTKKIYPDMISGLVRDEETKETAVIFPYFPTPVTKIDDQAIALELLRIYKETRRIVLDGSLYNNFKKDSKGQIICIDTGNAFRRNSKINAQIFGTNNIGKIADSEQYQIFFMKMKNRYGRNFLPLVMIKNLFYLEKNLDKKEIKDEYLDYNTIIALSFIVNHEISITENVLKVLNKNAVLQKALACIDQEFPKCKNSHKIFRSIVDNTHLQKAIAAGHDYLSHNPNIHGNKQTITYLKNLMKKDDFSEMAIKNETQCWLKGYGFFSSSSRKNYPFSRVNIISQYGLSKLSKK